MWVVCNNRYAVVMCSVGVGKMAVLLHAGETWLTLACCHQRMGQQEGHVNTQVLFVIHAIVRTSRRFVRVRKIAKSDC
jgi:hypothetical protein